MVSVCLPSDALLQHLPSYLGFSYLGRGVSLHGCSSKAQPLFLALDEGYLLTTALPDLQRGIAPLGPPAPTQPQLLGCGVGPPKQRLSLVLLVEQETVGNQHKFLCAGVTSSKLSFVKMNQTALGISRLKAAARSRGSVRKRLRGGQTSQNGSSRQVTPCLTHYRPAGAAVPGCTCKKLY